MSDNKKPQDFLISIIVVLLFILQLKDDKGTDDFEAFFSENTKNERQYEYALSILAVYVDVE